MIPEARNFPLDNLLEEKWRGENALEIMCFAEGTNGGRGVLMLRVNGVIEAANVGGSELARKFGERAPELRKFSEGGLADDGDSVIRWEIVEIVLQSDEAERINLPVGGIAGDDIHLMIKKRAVNEAEIHGGGRRGETKTVAAREPSITVRAFLEFIANAGTPFWRNGNEIRDSPQVKIVGVIRADDHGKSIFKAEWLGEFELETLGVKLFYALINGGGIGAGGFIENGGERGSGVFDV
jgi:hypothetical protein